MGTAVRADRRLWLDWLYREEFLIGASLARIGFGLIILYMYLIHYAQRYLLWSDGGLIDHDTYLAASMKDHAYSLYMFSPSLVYFDLIYHLGIVVIILYLIGWKGRIVSVLNFIFTISLMDRNVLISDGGDNIMRLVLFYLLFANTTAYFSADADAYWRRRPLVEHTMWYKIKAVLHNFAVLFCIINLCIMYLTSGLYQVMGEVWHNGTAVYYILQVDEYSHPFFQNLILQNDFLIVLSTYASVIDENVVQFDEAAVEPRREDGLGQMGSVFALGGCPQFPAVYLVRAGVPNGRARPEAAAGVAVAGRLASARANRSTGDDPAQCAVPFRDVQSHCSPVGKKGEAGAVQGWDRSMRDHLAGSLAVLHGRAFERHRIRHQFSGSGGDAALRLYALFGDLSALRTVYQGSAAGTGTHPPGKQRTGLRSR
ncbi:hypothetical protein O3V59_09055 [Brevibacillus thermoruber]|uniref:HTTM-like domain-containing protein n=1 Tax=Brevibacillus thermoruber TaxID=33942 RepID=A0A9X3TQ97_9BACL|nr:hypothetical protein [Brevibacillus thermoruber]MDA5108508.1 hypothetical protein [Brevibacillus thermoruber]